MRAVLDDALKHKFVLRMSESLRDEVHRTANLSKRSINKEIIARLEHSLRFYPTVPVLMQKLDPEILEDSKRQDFEMLVNQALKEKLSLMSLERKRILLKFLSAFS